VPQPHKTATCLLSPGGGIGWPTFSLRDRDGTSSQQSAAYIEVTLLSSALSGSLGDRQFGSAGFICGLEALPFHFMVSCMPSMLSCLI
jgi:hypothetical protein